PRAVSLRFDQPVTAEPNAIQVKNQLGKTVSRRSRSVGRAVTVPLARLPRGAYTVRWHVLSEDGHVVSGVFTFGVRANAPLPTEDALQLPFGRLWYGDLSSITGTRFGTAFVAMTLGFALVAAFLFLAWLTDRRALLWPAFVLGLGFASGLSLSGHSAADVGSSWPAELADWTHPPAPARRAGR